MDLVFYTLSHGARKLERRLLCKEVLHDRWTVLKDLDAATVKLRPIKEFLHLFNQVERTVLLGVFELEEIDEERYETLFSVSNGGVGVITTPHDGQTLLTQYHRFVLELFVLDQLKTAFPLIAPSKRCCPVCAAIQRELSLLSGRSENHPIHSSHAHIYGCAPFPPTFLVRCVSV